MTVPFAGVQHCSIRGTPKWEWGLRIMSAYKNRLFAIAAALVMVGGLAACGGEQEADAGEAGEASHAEQAGEHAAAEGMAAEGGAEAVGEEAGEHREGREAGEHSEGGEGGEHREGREGGEHGEGGEGGEHDEGGEGEESGVYIGRGDTWDVTRRGARLVLTFDAASDAFTGTVENTTGSTLCAVRVEVHLSTGTELGPTVRTDVSAGQSIEVELPTGGEEFDSWTAHPEVSSCSTS